MIAKFLPAQEESLPSLSAQVKASGTCRCLGIVCLPCPTRLEGKHPAAVLTAILLLLLASVLPLRAADTSLEREQDFAVRLVAAARQEAARQPIYRSAYYRGGYPPETEGVCTDLIWRAFRDSGFDLKAAIDSDIRRAPTAYPRAAKPDRNIDFRRVPNQTAFFRRHARSLDTVMPGDAATNVTWQAGDIVVFANPDHIAIISDRRNDAGVPYLLHNQGPWASEGDDFMDWYARGIVAHFRFRP